jgi:hypothetical protein
MVSAPGESTDDRVLCIPDGRLVMTMRGGEEKKWQYGRRSRAFFCGDKRSALRGFW